MMLYPDSGSSSSSFSLPKKDLLKSDQIPLADSYGLHDSVEGNHLSPVGSTYDSVDNQFWIQTRNTLGKGSPETRRAFDLLVSSSDDPLLYEYFTSAYSPLFGSVSGTADLLLGTEVEEFEQDGLVRDHTQSSKEGALDPGDSLLSKAHAESLVVSDNSLPFALLSISAEDSSSFADVLGEPTAEPYSVGSGSVQVFEKGQLLKSEHGAFPVFGGIGHEYINYNGGAQGRLGFPLDREQGVGSGVIIQRFEDGEIIYGAGATYTVIDGKKLAAGLDGGDEVNTTYTDTFTRAGGYSTIGAAINPVHPWENGSVQDFTGGPDGRGAIMKSDANNESFWVGGDLWNGYLEAGGPSGVLGFPVSDSYAVRNGVVAQNFNGGLLISSADGTFPVFGGIGYEYLFFNGGAAGRLGHPLDKEQGVGNGVIVQRFKNGEILYGAGATHTVIGGKRLAVGLDGGDTVNTTYTDTFARVGGHPTIGAAINPVHPWENGSVQDFRGGIDGPGAIMKSDANNESFWVGGDLWSGYLESGGPRGVLGYPTSDSYVSGNGLAQDFRSGTLYSSSYGAFPVFGGIRETYIRENGGAEGRLGHPSDKEQGVGNGVIIQRFENGEILFGDGFTRTIIGGQELAVGSDGSNAHATYINAHNRSGGWKRAGSPVNNVHPWKDGHVQDFIGGADGKGAIMKSNANDESFWVGGNVWLKYLETNGAEGILGYPTSDAFSVGSGASRQNFQGGAIYQTSKGAFTVYGGIGDYYLSKAGGENGRLGLPVGKEEGVGNGFILQNFEKGYILWNGTATAYKPDGSLLFPVATNGGSTTGSGEPISYQTYLSLLYRDGNGGDITQTYERHKAQNSGAIDSADNDADRKVYALAGGEITFIGKDQHGGNFIKVRNSTAQRSFIYLHFASFNPNLREGQSISKGDYLGFEGSTGNSSGVHTHVHVTKPDGSRENPLVTLGILGESNNSVEPVAPFIPPSIPSPLNDIGRAHYSNRSWLGKDLLESWQTVDYETRMVRFENGWIAKNNYTGEVEAFKEWERPSWIEKQYIDEFASHFGKAAKFFSPGETIVVDPTWSTDAKAVISKYKDLINLAALYYGVSGRAIAGIIRWEYEINTPSRETDAVAFKLVTDTGSWGPFNGTGWGKIHYTTARKILDKEPGLVHLDSGKVDNDLLARLLATPVTAIDLIARELRSAAKAYASQGFDIRDDAGVLSTLYRLGEKSPEGEDYPYEERAADRKQDGIAPTTESGDEFNDKAVLFDQKKIIIPKMGGWIQSKENSGSFNDFEDLS